jgi:hypothetical protein
MKITITSKKGWLDRILMKFAFVLFGIFLTSLVFAIPIKYFGERGIWAGFIISIGLIFSGFYYVEKGTKLRLLTWVMLITVISCSMIFLIGYSLISSSLEGF